MGSLRSSILSLRVLPHNIVLVPLWLTLVIGPLHGTDIVAELDQASRAGAYADLVRRALEADPALRIPEILTRVSDTVSQYGTYDPQDDSFVLDNMRLGFPLLLDAHVRALQAYPRFGALWLSQGNLQYRIFRTLAPGLAARNEARDQCIRSYERALQSGAKAPGIRERLGIALADAGDDARALAYLRSAVEEAPQNQSLLYLFAYVNQELGKSEEAARILVSLEGKINDPALERNQKLLLGEVHMSLRAWDRAVEAFETISLQEPYNLYPLRRILEAYSLQGDLERGSDQFRTYLERIPGDMDALERLARSVSTLPNAAELVATSTELRQRFARARPDFAAGLGWLEAFLLLEGGRPDEAQAVLTQSRAYLEDSPAQDAILPRLVELENLIPAVGPKP